MGANDLSLTRVNFKVNFMKLMPIKQFLRRNTQQSVNLDFHCIFGIVNPLTFSFAQINGIYFRLIVFSEEKQ